MLSFPYVQIYLDVTPLNEAELATYTFTISLRIVPTTITLHSFSKFLVRFPDQYDSSHLTSSHAQCILRYKKLNPIDNKFYDQDMPLLLSILNNEIQIHGFEQNDQIPSEFNLILYDVANPNVEAESTFFKNSFHLFNAYNNDSTYKNSQGNQINPVSSYSPLHLKNAQNSSGEMIKIFAIGFTASSVNNEVTHLSQNAA